VLTAVFGIGAALLLFSSALPALGAAAVAFPLVMGTFGVGNGAVFQLVGMRYRERIGVLTGLVGAAGGLGGFFLPTILGTARDAFGSYGPGIGAIAAVAAVALCGTLVVRGTWIAPAGAQA
jgi:NNP family nitrate/nitrite transporter-like MFS transporter